MKTLIRKTALASVLLSMALCCCSTAQQQPATSPVVKPQTDANQLPAKQEPKQPAKSSWRTAAAPAQPDIVAKIAEYVVTRQELQERLMMELRPYEYEQYNLTISPPDAKTVLTKMLAEKAMMMEGRRQNLLDDPAIHSAVKRFRDDNLANLLLQNYLQDKLTVTESEIEERIKADPRLDRAQAKTMLERAKANKLVEQYYSDIYARSHVKKLSDNFAKAAQIHQRLLSYPKVPRNVGWISNSQINTDLTPEEKDMVLATYDYGKLTLKDWFVNVCEIVPPRRPTDLNTPKGVERLLDIALRLPLFVSEAKLLGLDKDENLVKQVKQQEDSHLLYKVRADKVKDINEPTNEQIIDYFNKNKEVFITDRTLKLDQIWCQDLMTARKARAELDAGKDFESVRGLYSLDKKGGYFVASPDSEGIFFQDLWKGEPNQMIGPVKGFYEQGVKWRVVKILQKNPGKVGEYSSDMKDNIKWKMVGERGNALLENYGKELLEKYPHEIYADRIKDIYPLNIP
jgi:hypothetical protein